MKCPDCELPMFDLRARLDDASYANLHSCPQCKVLFRAQEYRDKRTGELRVALRREDRRRPHTWRWKKRRRK